MSVRILTGDCRTVLRSMPDESVNCIVTSPPYFGLRDYGVAGQIGLEPTPAEFVAELVEVFREARRVLRKDGVMFLNLGDSYFNSSAGGAQGKNGQRAGRRFTATGSGAGVRRATACDTSGKEPANSQERGCLCGNLCDGCRAAYRLGRSHSDGLRAPMRAASSRVSNLAHTGSEFGHPPTSGSVRPAGHSAAATPDLAPLLVHAGEPLPVSHLTTHLGSSPQHLEGSRLSGQPSECLSCGRSLRDCARVSAHTAGYTCDTCEPVSASDNSGRGASVLAYPHLTTESLKPKDLIGIPWRVAFALQADGWYLRSSIIWHKPNPMPESVTDRPTSAHENIFLFSRSERYFYDAEAVREPFQTDPKENYPERARITGRGKQGSSDARGNDRDKSGGFPPVEGGRNMRNVWTVATQPFGEAHFATFPPALIEPCIKAGCPLGGTVLDPFGGAGTTGLVADRLGRNAVLIELNPEYAAMARRRIEGDGGMFASVNLEAAE